MPGDAIPGRYFVSRGSPEGEILNLAKTIEFKYKATRIRPDDAKFCFSGELLSRKNARFLPSAIDRKKVQHLRQMLHTRASLLRATFEQGVNFFFVHRFPPGGILDDQLVF